MTLEELLAVAEIVEKLTNRYRDQEAAHKAALAELRASCNARTASDEHRPENLREEIIRLNDANGRLLVERDTLRGEVAALQERLRASIARGDFAQMELAQLKSPTPKHPVAVGGYLRRLTGFNTTPAGEVARVTLVDDADPSKLEYEVVRPNGQKGWWSAKGCEPCDPPATHDTPEGRSVAESVIRDFRTTEPAADIKDGDIVEVVSATHKIYTDPEDIGLRGVVTAIVGMRLSVRKVPGYELPICGIVGKCDVRKVPQ